MPAAIPDSPTGLYWNKRGDIRCERHAIEIEQIRWDAEVWVPIPKSEAPQRYQCQTCREGR